MKWTAEAPSNIALIKYMGKVDTQGNIPANGSLSWTLGDLRTRVELELEEPKLRAQGDRWEPLHGFAGSELQLSPRGAERFLSHLAFLKKDVFSFDGDFVVRSANNFPADCGLASSASSFAALTLAAVTAMSELTGREMPSAIQMSQWSRHGSGSSCRSFFSPWALWQGTEVGPVHLPFQDLCHLVVITESTTKTISSSEAHRRVTESDLFVGRVQRAETRLTRLLQAIEERRWKVAHDMIWAEFWDMHALFETSAEPFGYMNPESLSVLQRVRVLWREAGDGPWVTMDAGPNVHLLFRSDQEFVLEGLAREWSPKFPMIVKGEKRGLWSKN